MKKLLIMGKRLSGCNTSASYPTQGLGFAPIMGMVKGGIYPMMGYGWNNMIGGWGGFGILGWFSMILFWLLLLLGVIALLKWLTSSGKKRASKTPFEILKERFASGEIDKKEFEDKAKLLTRYGDKE